MIISPDLNVCVIGSEVIKLPDEE